MRILQNVYKAIFFVTLFGTTLFLYGENSRSFDDANPHHEMNALIEKPNMGVDIQYNQLKYYLFTQDFIESLVQIPFTPFTNPTSTVKATYLAGRAPVYNNNGLKVGVCSASFLCIQNSEDIFVDISNYLTVDNGLIVSWFTPATLADLESDILINSMVTECIVTSTTKIGVNPLYGKTFNMIVSSGQGKIYFQLSKI